MQRHPNPVCPGTPPRAVQSRSALACPCRVAAGVVLLAAGFLAACGGTRPADAPRAFPRQKTAASPEPAPPPLAEEHAQAIAELEAIGYLGGVNPVPQESGVTVHDPARARAGLNLYVSGHDSVAFLTDMAGNVLHTWAYPYERLWPDAGLPADHAYGWMWRRAALAPNGDLIAIVEGLGMFRLDKNSRLLWARPNRAHHDLEILGDGRVLTLTRKARMHPLFGDKAPILEDFVCLLSPDGEELVRVSVLEAILNGPFPHLREEVFGSFAYAASHRPAREQGDVLHTNTVEWVDDRLAARVPGVRPGNVLVACLEIGRAMVLDLETGRVVWALAPRFQPLHHPTVLDNGNILLLLNAWRPEKSAVFEVDPGTGDTVWSFTADDAPKGEFFTRTCGACYRLSNGNTLVAESDAGRAFEITPDRQVVWSFSNPHRAGDAGQFIATVYDLVRLESLSRPPWLEKTPPTGVSPR